MKKTLLQTREMFAVVSDYMILGLAPLLFAALVVGGRIMPDTPYRDYPPIVQQDKRDRERAFQTVIDVEARALTDASCVPADQWTAPQVPSTVVVQDYGTVHVRRLPFSDAWTLAQQGKVITLYICKG